MLQCVVVRSVLQWTCATLASACMAADRYTGSTVCVCYSVLQCVAVGCSWLQWVAVGFNLFYLLCRRQTRRCYNVNVLQCVPVCASVLQCGAVCCSVVQCVAVWCSVVQCGAVCCSLLHSHLLAIPQTDTPVAQHGCGQRSAL